MIDQQVAVELTDGLSVSGTPTYASGAMGTLDAPASVSYSNGVFNIGTLKRSDWNDGRHSVTLPVSVSNTAVVNEQCLTATISGNPPPGTGSRDDDISDNVAKLCLGDQPLEPLASGQIAAFTIYPCVGNTNPPCDDTDDVRVRAVRTTDESVLAAGKALVHISEEDSRIYDSHANSVSAGTIVSWQIPVTWDASEFNAVNTQWSNLRDGFTASGSSGGAPPGAVNIRAFEGETYEIIYKMNPDTTPPWTGEDTIGFNPGSNNGPYTYTAEFEKLGTYKLQFTAKLTRATLDGDENCDPNTADPAVNQKFCATETYIFHVGPMRELAVEDGGASSRASADQHALTIVPVNNGPGHSPGATVTGLPTGAEVIHVSQGAYDSAAGEWNIGELKVRGYYRSAGVPEPTLVLSAAAGDTASVSIASSKNYEVCIGGKDNPGNLAHTTKDACEADTATGVSWHSTPVYDYNSDNNTATITARAGTGGIGEGIPTMETPAVHTPAVGIAWSEVEFLHGVPVKDYRVQWSTNGVSGWTQLESDLSFNKLFDITIQSGQTRYYRVRAVSEADVPGPWSAPMAAMPIDTSVPGITISETELTIREGESAQYTVALHARPHANVSVRINGGGVVSPNPGTLTFNTNDFNMPKTVELTGIQDNDPDNEQVNVTHTISSSDAGYRSLTPDPVAVTVLDDDSGVSVTAEQASVNEGEDITFTLTRTGNTDSAITAELSVSQRGSFLPADQLGARSVSIGANVDAETVTVETENDTVIENAGSVTLVVNSGTGYLLGTPRSATVSVQDDDGAPGQPGTLRAVEGDQQVTLSWDAAPVGDAPVLDYSYRMRRSDRSNWDPDWTTLSGGSTRRSHTVTGLTNGQEYIFQVRARNATGDGAEAEVRVNTRTIPGRPEVTATARHQSLVVTWDVPDTGGRPTTEYRVQWKSGTESFDTTRQATTTTREHTIPNLTNGTEYRVRVQARTEAGWSVWSVERAGTPVARPATSLSITTNARDGVSEPFRVTFTFTDEDHDGNRFGVEGFDVDDIEVRYSPTVGYVFSMKDFREEVAGFRYSARLEDILEGTLSITVKEGAAQSTEDGQRSTAASHSIRVEVPEAVAPTGTEIWAAEMTVGEYTGNARGYINPGLSEWNVTGEIGSLSDNDDTFTYGGKDYTVGEVSFVPAWSSILFSVCPGIEGVNRAFDLYLDDQIADHADLTLNFDSDKVSTSKFDVTIAGVRQTCVEYSWTPRRVDWEEDGTVNVRLVR